MPADYGNINIELGALDTTDRYTLERASGAQTLLKVRRWDYNGVNMDYKMDETGVYDATQSAFMKESPMMIVQTLTMLMDA